MKFHIKKHFKESILFEQLNSDRKRTNPKPYKNIEVIEKEVPRFQIYPETELSFIYTKAIFSHTIFRKKDDDKRFDMNTGHLIFFDAQLNQNNPTDVKSQTPVTF